MFREHPFLPLFDPGGRRLGPPRVGRGRPHLLPHGIGARPGVGHSRADWRQTCHVTQKSSTAQWVICPRGHRCYRIRVLGHGDGVALPVLLQIDGRVLMVPPGKAGAERDTGLALRRFHLKYGKY